MSVLAAAVIVFAIGLDLAAAEFPERIHPVALFGRSVAPVDRSWARPRFIGTLVAIGFPLIAAGLIGGIVFVTVQTHPALGGVIAGIALFSTISVRMLVDTATDVVDLSVANPDDARSTVRALVGRDAAALSPGELRSAAVESAAENLSDGFIAPFLAFVLGTHVSLSVAAGAAVWVKAVNTLDSMLGYEDKPVGWASARLDDVVMWLPARCTAVLLAVVARDPNVLLEARTSARAPPSPNAGWPMGALAAVVDVKLHKPGSYTLRAAGDLPSPNQARRGIRCVTHTALFAGGLGVVIAWF